MITTTIDINEAQKHLTELVASVKTGEEIILTKDNAPIARLTPLANAAMQRIPDLNAGSIWTSPDFDAPLPDDFWTGEA
jgi:prevent-host-death family protein